MKRSFSAIVFVLLLLSSCPAFAEKARSIDSDAASAYHAQHLALHVGSAVCTCTGNYVKIRAKISGDEVVGHLEQADSFELMDVKDGLALIYILDSAQTSPDSRAQMSGWVNADYIDCPCNPSEYEDADNINPLSGSVFPSGTPKEWSLLSGASAWSTELYLQSDGSFSGYYHDSDMGATGDAYPNGTLYESSFSGSFSEINRANNFVYSMTVTDLHVAGEIGSQYIEDGILHIVTDAVGLKAEDDFCLYLPGTEKSDIPETCLSWIYASATDPIDHFILCNLTQEFGFNPGI